MTQVVIKDGFGTGRTARVDQDNRLDVHATTRPQVVSNGYKGQSFNINTGIISLTEASASAVLHIKNSESIPLVLQGLFVGIGTRPSPTEQAIIRVYRNPTGGTIVDNATSVDVHVNRNFSSNKLISGSFYKGAEGYTTTNGTEALVLYASDGRLAAGLDLILYQGDTMSVTIEPNDTTGCDVYAALGCYLEGDAN